MVRSSLKIAKNLEGKKNPPRKPIDTQLDGNYTSLTRTAITSTIMLVHRSRSRQLQFFPLT